jgi:copper chaperone CopZ
VEKVKVDLKKDLLHIRFDTAKVTREQMLQAIDKLGYEGKDPPAGDAKSES